MVWKSFKKVRSRKPAIVTPLFLFGQLQVNINFILRKICFHRDLSRTPDSLCSPSSARAEAGFLFVFVYFTHWASVQEEQVPLV